MDEIFTQTASLQSTWAKYKRMAKAIETDPGRYNADAEKMWQLEKLLLELKGQLMDGEIFRQAITQEFEFAGLIDVRTNRALKDEFFRNVKTLFLVISKKVGNSAEYNHRETLPGVYGLYALYMTIWKDPSDKKLVKQIWDLHKRVPIVPLTAHLNW